MQQRDDMESFVLAKTFKYFWPLFHPDSIGFDTATFNTEAHPLQRT